MDTQTIVLFVSGLLCGSLIGPSGVILMIMTGISYYKRHELLKLIDQTNVREKVQELITSQPLSPTT